MARDTQRPRPRAPMRELDAGRAERRRAAARDAQRRRRAALVAGLALVVAVVVAIAATRGGSTGTSAAHAASSGTTASHGASTSTARSRGATHTRTHHLSGPHVSVAPPAALSANWTTVATVYDSPAVWVAERSSVVLMRFDQRHVHLNLHTGYTDGGTLGWTYGDQITPREIHLVLAAFNGGFKLTYSDVGFVSGGRVAVALKPGLGSLVTYTDGTSNIGAWDNGVPTKRKTVYSVLQNQRLLVDRGVAAPTVSNCVIACWGATIGGAISVARSALGISQDGQLIWAAGESLTPAQIADALVSAGAVRAIELDINPDWVAGYLYAHHATGPVAVPVIPGQLGLAGQLLAPYSRDFLAVVAN